MYTAKLCALDGSRSKICIPSSWLPVPILSQNWRGFDWELGTKEPRTGVNMPATSRKKTASKSHSKTGRRWSASVTTDSTHPPAGLFTKNASTIARSLASKKVSPKGPTSGMRMLTFFINRAGKGLSTGRRAELEKAKELLSERIKREKARAA